LPCKSAKRAKWKNHCLILSLGVTMVGIDLFAVNAKSQQETLRRQEVDQH
jgi:hypothetical protein